MSSPTEDAAEPGRGERVTANTAHGTLVGLDAGDGVAAFKGIRFAEAPVGQRRWRPPVPAEAWSEERSATCFGPACVQIRVPATSIYAQYPARVSEDCLFLNVWQRRGATGMPVMVWLHGGSLRMGDPASGMYDGAVIARTGVVFVSVNYRLGVLGYLAHPQLSAESPHGSSGNYGLLDQIEALRWVREHIAAFGGDPDNVTVFGESAGALSGMLLMTSPLARGLFHKIILQSGSLVASAELKRSSFGQPSAESTGERLAGDLGAADVGALRALNAGMLVEQAAAAGFIPRPTIDGWVLPRQTIEVFERGEQAPVPMIVGFTEGEIRTLRALLPPLPGSAEQYEARVRSLYGDLAERYLGHYPSTNIEQSALAATRDAFFGWSAERLARMQTALGLPAHLYFFAHQYPAQQPLKLEAFHGSELPYEFGRIGASEGWPERWPRPPDDAREQALSEAIMGCFTSFARDGTPTARAVPAWRPYGPRREYLEFGDTPRAASELMPGVFELHEEVIARRRAMGTQPWYVNVGLGAPSAPKADRGG